MVCDVCGTRVKSEQGLRKHQAEKHPAPSPTTNVDALQVTINELQRLGRLETIDAAKVQAVRSMAVSLDEKPFNSQMFHEYLSALEELTTDGDSDGSVDELLRELSA